MISVILPTHNPHAVRLRRALDGLARQTFPASAWELVVVDNASISPLTSALFDGLSLPHARIVVEPVMGLTAARRRGLLEARGECCVFVDDDNVLAPDYLASVEQVFAAHPQLGAAGGLSRPEFESPPAPWVEEFFPLLALRDLGPAPLVANWPQAGDQLRRDYPPCAPIGAGMALRRTAVEPWLTDAGAAALPDRCGTALSSGGDNDIVLSILSAGWQVGYFPELLLTHLIPASRLDAEYLGRINHAMQKSWVQVLARHGLRPWPAITRRGALLRQARAWFRHRAWSSPAAWVRWKGACGQFEGRSAIPPAPASPEPQRTSP